MKLRSDFIKVKQKIYLAHTVRTRKEVKNIYEPQISVFFDVINPFNNNPYEIVDEYTEQYLRMQINNPYTLVQRDLDLIDECQALIAILLDGPSYGTVFEIAYAHQKRYPIYVCCNLVDHPWLLVYADILNGTDQFLHGLMNYVGLRKYSNN